MTNKSIFKLCLVIALTVTAASAYAGATTISSPLTIGGGTFSPSNKVVITYDAGPTSAPFGSQYAARSKHGSGDRQFATNNTDPKLYYKTVNVTAACETSVSTDVFTSGWTSM